MNDTIFNDDDEDLTEYEDKIDLKENEESDFEVDYNLSTYGADYDVAGLVRRLENESIYLPVFQRKYVWSKSKASRFIESLLLGLPIPNICLYKENTGKQLIIDGYQRLESIKRFYNGSFKLTSVSKRFEKKSINTLGEELRIKLDDTILHSTIVKAENPIEKNFNAVYLIFERLNTGGMNLTPQEIRACVYHGNFQNAIENLAETESFVNVINVDTKRKRDQEIVLRMLALCNNYKNYSGNMKAFLNEYMDTNKDLTEKDLTKIKTLFNNTADILDKLDDTILRPNKQLNLAILDAVFVGIFLNLENGKRLDYAVYNKKINELISTKQFQDCIKTGKTHHTNLLQERIRLAIEALSNNE